MTYHPVRPSCYGTFSDKSISGCEFCPIANDCANFKSLCETAPEEENNVTQMD